MPKKTAPTEYRYHSPLSPEAAWEALERHVEERNQVLNHWQEAPAENIYWKGKWELSRQEGTLFLNYVFSRMSRGKSAQLALSAAEKEGSDDDVDRSDAVNPFVQRFRGDIFRGSLEPEGEGCLLRGSFGATVGNGLFHILMVALGVGIVVLAGGIAKLAGVFMAGFYLRNLLKVSQTADSNPMNRETLQFLKDCFGEPESAQPEG